MVKILFWIIVFMVIYQFFIKPARQPVEPPNKQAMDGDKQAMDGDKQKFTDSLPAEDIDYEEID